MSGGAPLNFAPQILADLNPVVANGYFYPRTGLDLLNQHSLYGEMYRKQPWVYTVVGKLAKSASRLPINAWETVDGERQIAAPTTPLARFIQNPCLNMPLTRLISWTWRTRKIHGAAYWLKVRANGRLTVFPMHPSRTAIERDPKTGDLTYIFTTGVASAGILRVNEADVVPFVDYDPDTLMRGMSPLEPLRNTLFNEDASRRGIESFWKRGARPSLMISAPNTLSEGAYNRLSSTISNVHGGADQMGGTLVLEEGAKPIPVQLTAEEMQYIESRKLNREEVCSAYDVPPPAVHILDHATFSNITEQMRSVYRDTMAPDLTEFEDIIRFYVVEPEFDASGNSEVRFALDDVLRGDFETRATAVTALTQNGVMKPSEARPLFDLGDAGPEADRLYANSAIQPLGHPAEGIRITAGTTTDPLPLTPGEQADVTAVEQERQQEQAPSESSKRRTRYRNSRRAILRGSADEEHTDDEA